MKIVIHRGYGGFNLSDEATYLWASRKNMLLYKDADSFYTAPISKEFQDVQHMRCPEGMDRNEFARLRDEWLTWNRDHWFDINKIDRSDSDLVAVVEELGPSSFGKGVMKLRIVEIPDGVDYYIQIEEDGHECIHEKHRIWS